MSGMIRVRRAFAGGVCAAALIGLASPTLVRAGEKHHRRQLYQAVQGYMLQAPAASPAPSSCSHAHCCACANGAAAAPSPQSVGGGAPSKGTPQMSAHPPSVGQAPPIMTLPPAAPAATPTLGQAPSAPIQTLAPPVLGTPILGVAPVQQVQFQVVTVPIQQVTLPVLGQAPTLSQAPAPAPTATPVTVLVPYEKPCLLNLLHR